MPSLKSTTTKKALLPIDPEGEERGVRYVHLTQGFLNNLGPADERMRLTDIRSVGLSVRLETSGRHSWQVRLQSKTGSRQLWETFGKVADMSLKEARAEADELRRMARQDPNARQALSKERAQKLPFEELAEMWMEDYVSELKPGTQRSYRQKLDLYIKPRFVGKKLRQMDNASISTWHTDISTKGICAVDKESKRKPHRAETTADGAFRALKSFFKYATKMKWISINPTRDVKANGDHKIHRPLDESARRKVGETMNEMILDGSVNVIYLRAVQLSLATSLRRDSLTTLEWREVHLERKFFQLVSKTATHLKPQYLVMGPMAYSILKSIPRILDSPYVFPGRDPMRPMGLSTLNATWSKIRERAGVYADYPETDRYGTYIEKPPIRPHDLRHTKTAKLAETEENPMIGAVVGIKTTEVLDRYSSPVKAKVAEVNTRTETDFAEDLGVAIDPEFYTAGARAKVAAPEPIQVVIQVGSWPPRGVRKAKEKAPPVPKVPKARKTLVDYPSDEELQKMVLERPVSVVAVELGLKPKTLEKHCKMRGLRVMPRGHWAKERAAGRY
jgi:integrase